METDSWTPPPGILTQGVWAVPEILFLSQVMLKLLVCGSDFEYQCLDYILSKDTHMSHIT